MCAVSSAICPLPESIVWFYSTSGPTSRFSKKHSTVSSPIRAHRSSEVVEKLTSSVSHPLLPCSSNMFYSVWILTVRTGAARDRSGVPAVLAQGRGTSRGSRGARTRARAPWKQPVQGHGQGWGRDRVQRHRRLTGGER